MGRQAGTDVYLLAEQLRARVPGGIGTHTRAILQRLSFLRSDFPEIRLHVVASRVKGDDPLEEFNLPIRRLPFSHEIFMRLSGTRIGLVGSRPGIYHSFSMLVPHVGNRSSLKVCTVHDLAFLSNPAFFTQRGVEWHTRQLKAIVDGKFPVVVVSELTGAYLMTTGVTSERIHVIESGADHLCSPDIGETEKFLRSLNIQNGFLLSVSTIEPRKNLDGLIAGYRLARAADPSLPELLIVGPFGWGSSPERVPDVHFLGHVSEEVLVGLYRSASMLVYVPFEEGFGLPVVEAMLNRLPVVGSQVPSGANAMEVVDPHIPESIAGGILKVFHDPNRRAQLCELGLARAGSLKWDGVARKHLELWRKMHQ